MTAMVIAPSSTVSFAHAGNITDDGIISTWHIGNAPEQELPDSGEVLQSTENGLINTRHRQPTITAAITTLSPHKVRWTKTVH